MTQGSVWKHIILFSLPLIAGNLVQQLYNTVDSIVVGNFVGKEALAATGAVFPIMFALIGFFSGFAMGAGVVISQYFGANDDENVSAAVQTTMAFSFILCALLSVAGVLMADPLLRLMQIPDDVFGQASTYLRICFAGLSGTLLYNMTSGIQRAVGDSRHPLYFLIFSAVLNTVLDLVFVISFHMGIAGAAWATIISQILSAILNMVVLTRTHASYRILWGHLKIDGGMLKKIIRVGLPSAIQMTITAISNIFVQAYINGFQSAAMAGWSAYMKLDAFMMVPMMSIGMAATTFVGQNIGAGLKDRARKGTRSSFLLAELITISVLAVLMIFAPQAVRLFSGEDDVIYYGVYFMRFLSPFYILCVVNQVYSGALRGAGDSQAPMFIMLGSFVVFRQIYLFAAARLSGSVASIAFGYPAGWILCSVTMYLYYRSGRWEKYMVAGRKDDTGI